MDHKLEAASSRERERKDQVSREEGKRLPDYQQGSGWRRGKGHGVYNREIDRKMVPDERLAGDQIGAGRGLGTSPWSDPSPTPLLGMAPHDHGEQGKEEEA
jgi:hypothetical protein